MTGVSIVDLTTLTDDDLDALRVEVFTEQERRRLIADAPAQAVALADRYAAAIGRKDGDPYQPVTGAHDAYHKGSIVSQSGDYYRATAWAYHAPGTTGAPWERVWPDGPGWTTTPPSAAGPIPWAVGINAIAGETIVSNAGRLWRCKTTHVTHAGWPPSAATHAVWTDLGPA